MKTVYLYRILRFVQKSYADDNKRFSASIEVWEQKSRGKNIREGPTMLQKTKENESDKLDGPTILMIINSLV
jgi:hypothetical protein